MKFLTLVIAMTSVTAFAKPAYLGQLKTSMPTAKNVSCNTCHDKLPTLNVFGVDYKKLVVETAFSKEGFQALMDADSNKNGITNYAELLAGTNPGTVAE